MEDNTFKTIIITCLVAIVAILGVSAYFFINNANKEAMSNNNLSSNQTIQNTSNSSLNNSNLSSSSSKSSKTTSKTKDKPAVISASKAMSIVTNAFSGYDCYGGGAELFMSNGKPVYSVSLYNRQDDSSAGTVLVDAETGKILS